MNSSTVFVFAVLVAVISAAAINEQPQALNRREHVKGGSGSHHHANLTQNPQGALEGVIEQLKTMIETFTGLVVTSTTGFTTVTRQLANNLTKIYIVLTQVSHSYNGTDRTIILNVAHNVSSIIKTLPSLSHNNLTVAHEKTLIIALVKDLESFLPLLEYVAYNISSGNVSGSSPQQANKLSNTRKHGQKHHHGSTTDSSSSSESTPATSTSSETTPAESTTSTTEAATTTSTEVPTTTPGEVPQP